MYVNEDECEAAGLDPKEVERIAKGLSRYAREARKLGIEIFGGSGTGSLRFDDGKPPGRLIIAFLDGHFDGGDGGQGSSTENQDGLIRGES